MSRATDVASLLTGGGAADIGFHQGVVTAWDESTGTNSVDIGGTVLSNLPALNLGDFVHLAQDDVVGILRFKTTYFILGRVILPAAVDRNRATIDFDSVGVSASNFTVSNTSPADKVSGAINVPSWADEVMVFCHIYATIQNNSASVTFLNGAATIAGVQGGSAISGNVGASGSWAYVAASALRIFNVSGNPSFAVGGRLWGTTSLGAVSASNTINLNATAVFRRID